MEILTNFSLIYCFIMLIISAGSVFMLVILCIEAIAKKKKLRNKVHFYVARDKYGSLWLYLNKQFKKDSIFDGNIREGVVILTCHLSYFGLNENDYANIKWEDEPVEVFLNFED